MSRYPRSARSASIKCISCNAPAAKTVEDAFVCVACGNVVVQPKASSNGSDSRSAHVDPPSADAVGESSIRTNGGTSKGSGTNGEPVADGHGNLADEGTDGSPERSVSELNTPTTDGGVLESIAGGQTVDPLAPAIGVIATGDRSDAVVRTIARAVDRGHEVLLTYRDDPDSETLGVARSLGATIVNPAGERDDRSLRAQLESAGRDMSLPGIVVQTEPFARIDYDRSMAAFGPDEYVVDAVPEHVDQGPGVLTAIPACNEEDTIAEVVRAAARYSDEVIVIDDGSVDGTRERAEAAGATVVRHRRNRGYGAALKTAFEEGKARSAERLVVLDGDGQHDATDIPALLSALDDEDADVVIGSRFVDGSDTKVPRYRRFGISVINFLMNLSVGVLRPSSFISDTQSGFRAYRSEVVEMLSEAPGISDDMEASVDILYHVHTNGYRIGEVGTTIDYTVESPNSRNPVVHGYGIVKTLVQTIERDRPLTTLGLPGVLSLSTGIGLVISLVTAGAAGPTAPAVAIAAAVLMAIGIVASLAAAVLHGFNLNRHYLEK